MGLPLRENATYVCLRVVYVHVLVAYEDANRCVLAIRMYSRTGISLDEMQYSRVAFARNYVHRLALKAAQNSSSSNPS